jgi:hypothetical protein
LIAIRLDREDRTALAVRISDNNDAVGKYGRRHRNIAAAFQRPQFLAGLEIVTGYFLPSVHHHLPSAGA